VSVCLSAHNSETGRAIVPKFSGYLQGTRGMVCRRKNRGSWVGVRKFTLFGCEDGWWE